MSEQNNQNLEFSKEDIEQNKVMALLAYIIFFIPLLAAKDSPFARYHANQGLILFITSVIINIAGAIIPFIGWLIILPFGNIFVLILIILGIVNAANGKAKPLPLIGKFKILN